MAWHLALATFPAALIGFLAGLLSFRLKQRWCSVCGAMLTCPDPTYHGDLSQDRRPQHDSRRNAAPAGTRRTPTNRRTNAVRGAGESAGGRQRAL